MILKLLITIYQIIQVLNNNLVINNQINELSLYQIRNVDQEFSLWLRIQTQSNKYQELSIPVPFALINTQKYQIIFLFCLQPNQQLEILISIPQLQYNDSLMQNGKYDSQTWFCIKLLKNEEFQQVQLNNKTLILPQFQQTLETIYGNLISWQNLIFTLKAYLGHQEQIQYDKYYLKNHPIVFLSQQIIMNYKNQILIEMYLRNKYEEDHPILQIRDQEYNYSLFYGFSTVIIEIKQEYYFETQQFKDIYHGQWFKYIVYFEANKTITQINTLQNQFEWIYNNKFMPVIHGYTPLYYGTKIIFQSRYTEIDNIIITNTQNNKYNGSDICFPRCKKCLQMECLECESNLNISQQCSCDQNQLYNLSLQKCQDIYQYQGIVQNEQYVVICQLYEYYNNHYQKCMKWQIYIYDSPRIDQYYCTDCVFNTKLWRENYICTFQEIFTNLFLNAKAINFYLEQISYYIAFDQYYQQIMNNQCEYFQEDGLIICKYYKWDNLFLQICEYDNVFKRCNAQRGYFNKYQNDLMCSQGYTIININCIKCPLNCVICEYKSYKIQCLITKEGFYIGLNDSLIKPCTNENSNYFISTKTQQQTLEQPQNCQIKYKLYCLYCDQNYILNEMLECVLGQSTSILYNFEYFQNNFIKLSKQQLMQIIENQQYQIHQSILSQVLFYGLQYENIHSNQLYATSNHLCNKYMHFNRTSKCIQFKNNFQRIENNQIIHYLPNQSSIYKLSLNIIVYISHVQTVMYKNNTYRNIQSLLDNLNYYLYLSEIIINADVFVFDSFIINCYDGQTFLIDYNYMDLHFPDTLIRLDIKFQTISKFPDCWNESFYSNIKYLIIRNLQTSNKLFMEFHSQEVQLIDCQFFNEQSIVFMATKIVLQNVSFQNSIQQYTLLDIQDENYIQEIQLISCNFINIVIEEHVLILIQTFVQKFVIKNVTFSYINIYNSSFILFNAFNLFQIEGMIITQLQSNLSTIITQTQLNHKDGRIYIYNVYLIYSELYFSVFYQINYKAHIQNLKIIQSRFCLSHLFNINNKVLLHNIIFQEIHLEQSSLLQFIADQYYIIIKEVQILDSYFNQAFQCIEIQAFDIQIEGFYIMNCNYLPPFNLMNIKAKFCTFQFLTVMNITIDKKYSQLNVPLTDYLFDFNIISIVILNSKFNNIIFNQFMLAHIQFQLATIIDFILSNSSLIGPSQNEIIRLVQFDESSIIQMEKIKLIGIKIKWLQQSQLIHLQGKSGISYISYLAIQNITSFFEHQIFFCSQTNLFITKILLINFQQKLGFLKQKQSQVQIYNYYQHEEPSNQDQWNIPIFISLGFESKQEILQMENATFINIRQPILKFHNVQVQLNLFNITIQQYQGLSPILDLTKGNLSEKRNYIVFQIYLENILVQNTFQFQSIFLKSSFCKVIMSKIQFLNTNVVILDGSQVEYLKVVNIKLQNSNLQNQSHFILNNINSKSASNIDHQMLVNIYNVFIKSCNSNSNLIKINKMSQGPLQLSLGGIQIEQSNFESDLFIIYSINNLVITIRNILINNTKLHRLVENSQKQIIWNFYALILINVEFQREILPDRAKLYNSYLFNSTFNGSQIALNSQSMVWSQNQKLRSQPIQLSFNKQNTFNQRQIKEDLYQVYFNNNHTFVYVPSGIPLSNFIYINPITKQQERPYDDFVIILNIQTNEQIKCSLEQSINNLQDRFSNINLFILNNEINIIHNFTFYMNPYLNYSFIQNDIICNNITLRFNIRTLPCQLGEYLYQNQCLICDITKNYYSVAFKAQFCNIIDHRIEQLKVGNIKIKPGFWRPKLDSNQIEQCNNELCQGGWTTGDDSCEKGYVGALCVECDIYNKRGQGQYAKQNDACKLCDFNYQVVLKGILIALWLMLLGYLSYNTNKQITEQYLIFKLTKRNVADILMRQSTNQISIILKILTNYIFYLYLLKDKLNFIYYQVHISIDFISNPNLLVKPQLDCLFVEFNQLKIHYIQLIFTILSPFYILSFFYFIYLIFLKLKVIKFQFNLIQITIYSVYLFNQQLIFQNQIQLLSFKTASNIKWINLNQQFQFNTSRHYHMMFIYIIPSTILLLLIPVILFMILKRKDKKSIQTSKYYGLLYKDYKSDSYYWEIVRIYQKYIIIILFYVGDQYMQLSISVFFTLLIFNQPYALKNLNYLESKSFYLLTLVINISLMTQNSDQSKAIMFLLLNLILIRHIIIILIQKAQLQYKDRLTNAKQTMINYIPQAGKYINMKKSLKLSNNMNKLKSFYQNSKGKLSNKTGDFQVVLTRSNFETLQTDNIQTEIEMINIKY